MLIYLLVQPWGRDKYRQAGRISSHPTVEEAYAEMDRIAAMLEEARRSAILVRRATN